MPHDPQTLAMLSSAGHWLTGAFVLPVAALIAFESFGELGLAPWRFAVPSFIITSGVALAAFIVFHAGIAGAPEMLRYALNDAKQIQHFAIAAVIVLIGLAEWRARASAARQSLWSIVWPLSYALMGLGLVVHDQSGDHSQSVVLPYRPWRRGPTRVGIAFVSSPRLDFVARRRTRVCNVTRD